ncbi:MAG: hypothetical protein WCB85_08440 [Candidatus Dormiibacterota bacterium]
MNAANNSTAWNRLRAWWLTPPRTGLQRLIHPWEYRHLRFWGVRKIAAGSVAVAVGIICLAYAGYGWAAPFLVVAALNIAWGCWDLAIARSASAGRKA